MATNIIAGALRDDRDDECSGDYEEEEDVGEEEGAGSKQCGGETGAAPCESPEEEDHLPGLPRALLPPGE